MTSPGGEIPPGGLRLKPLTLPDIFRATGQRDEDVIAVVGIGAGLVSALLFAVVITGSPLAVLLFYVAPLPVFIAALGWNHRAGLMAVTVGSLAIAFELRPVVGMAFAVGAAIPAWWIAYLSLLGRADASGHVEWYPLGRILMWICLTSALVTVGGAAAISSSHEAYVSIIRHELLSFLTGQGRPGFAMPSAVGNLSVEELARILTQAVPYVAAASFVPMICANLWLGARTVALSGRLPRPWPFIPSAQMPREAAFALGLAVFLGFLPGFIGFFGAALSGAFFAGYALTGLTTIHVLTLRQSWRFGALSGLYAVLFFGLVWLVPLLALLGLADSLFDLRRRQPPASLTPHN